MDSGVDQSPGRTELSPLVPSQWLDDWSKCRKGEGKEKEVVPAKLCQERVRGVSLLP